MSGPVKKHVWNWCLNKVDAFEAGTLNRNREIQITLYVCASLTNSIFNVSHVWGSSPNWIEKILYCSKQTYPGLYFFGFKTSFLWHKTNFTAKLILNAQSCKLLSDITTPTMDIIMLWRYRGESFIIFGNILLTVPLFSKNQDLHVAFNMFSTCIFTNSKLIIISNNWQLNEKKRFELLWNL